MKNVGIVKNFQLYSIKSNEINTLRCVVENDEFFIHGYCTNNGKSISSMNNVNVYMNYDGETQVDIKSRIHSNSNNKINISQFTTLKPEYVDITIVTTNINPENTDSILIGLK